MSDSVDRVFVHALNTVKKIPRTGTARPPAAERLKLYGLYKQSMEGDVEGIMDRPIGDAPDVQAEREKWDAWYSQRGSSRTEAKRRYITTLINTMHLYASQTAEARELVAELEFVWDQIKYNAASSSTSSSSPIQATRTLPSVSVSAAGASRRYGSIDDRMTRSPAVDVEDQDEDLAIYRRRSGDSRLRVLSPVSQSDEADVRSHRHANEDHDNNDEDDDDDDEDDDDEDDFQEARTGTSFSDTSHHDANIEHEDDNTNHRTRKKRRRRLSKSQSTDWRHRIEQALTKMTTEIAALREQLDSLPITHHSHHSHSLRRPSNFFSWILSWGKWFLFHTLRQLLWQSIILSITLIWLRSRGDTRLERRVITILLQLRRRMMNAIRSVPRRLPKLLHLPLL